MSHRKCLSLSDVVLIAATVAASLVAGHAFAQTGAYPSKPIKIIVPFTPGGSNDVLARVVAQKLSDAWQQPVVVENRPGAAGHIGAEVVAKSPPDGYTLLVAPNDVLTIGPNLYDKLSYDPVKELDPVAMLGELSIVLVVNSASPIKSVGDLIAAAKAKPGALTYASAGGGSPQHISAELFSQLAGVKMVNVPYKGTGPAMADLLGGQVDMLFSPINSALPQIKAGKLRPLGVASGARVSYVPDVPTIAETGLTGYKNEIWIGLFAPAGTPKDIVGRLNGEVKKMQEQQDTKDRLAAQGIEVKSTSPQELSQLIASDTAKWSKIIKETGVKPD